MSSKYDGNENISDILSKAKAGDAEAQNLLGNLYYDGKGVKPNYALSFAWTKKAAKKGTLRRKRISGICINWVVV